MNLASHTYRILSGLSILLLWGCSKQIIVEYPPVNETPKNVILMIGDGMGLSHISAHYYQEKGSIFTKFRDVGLVSTHSADNVVTDSGAGATAFAIGQKALNNSVGLDENGIAHPSIMDLAKQQGFATGIVTTASIIDATPAAFYAHQKNRYWGDSISRNLLESSLDFVLGAGTKFFDDRMEGSPYNYKDFENKGFLVGDIFQYPVSQIPAGTKKRILYFNGVETALVKQIGVDHLRAASSKALQYLNKRNPFFLMIEGAQIDWAGHAGKGDELFFRMKGFELAIKSVMEFVQKDKNTLLIITADHATGGLAIVDGSKFGNVDLKFSTNGHTGDFVPIFAYGPGADQFRGVMDNKDIFYKLTTLLNLPSPIAANNLTSK